MPAPLPTLRGLLHAMASVMVIGLLAAPVARAQYAFTRIDVPGATEAEAYDINATRQIVGYYTDATGAHAFLATPSSLTAPEPGPLAVVVAGLGGVWACVRRRTGRMVRAEAHSASPV